VIGADVSIGRNVMITGSYIWDGVEIGDNVTIANALI
jgi:UDP-3-O-[3-hydroxymyristoyl] glucosamine N-acyltransferase